MKKIFELFKFDIKLYFKGARFAMPLIIMALFIFVMYYNTNAYDIVQICQITYYFVFLLMVWIGVSIVSSENVNLEQLLILRTNNEIFYYVSKFLSWVFLGMLVNVICYLIPVMMILVSGGGLFTRTVTVSDVAGSYLVLCGAAMAGGGLGVFFHPVILKDRKMALALTSLTAVTAIARAGMFSSFAPLKMLLWLVPPLDRIKIFTETGLDTLLVRDAALLFLILFFYTIICYTIRSFICYKKGF